MFDILGNGSGALLGFLGARVWADGISAYAWRWARETGTRLSLKKVMGVFLGYATLTFLFSAVTVIPHLSSWDPTFPLILGNEGTGDRPWRGRILELSIADRALSEEEVNRLYERRWSEDWYRNGATLEYKMRCLVEAGEYEAVAMHFRNAYMVEYDEAPDSLLDAYHVRNNSEGVNGHLKEHYGLEEALNVVGVRAITRHVLWTMLAAHIVAMVRLQHGVKDNLLSTTHLH